VFGVIEHQQHPPGAQVVVQDLGQRPRAELPQAQGLGDSGHRQARIAHRR
jgi:hypothetical protein